MDLPEGITGAFRASEIRSGGVGGGEFEGSGGEGGRTVRAEEG